MCVCVMCGTWMYLHDYHLYERTSACNYRLYDCYQNAVNDRLLLMIWPICMIIICMDAHQHVITDCNQCECLAISVYVCMVWSKMVPSMAAVLRASRKLCSFSYVLFVILLFYELDVVSITVYDRHTLLNIGSFVMQRKPDFEFLNAGALFTDTASEPFVWAARPRQRKRRRKRGKRAGVLVRLRRRLLRPPLPTILLANVQSLDNKLCELRARISYQRETRDCCIICLTETWMSAVVPDSAIELTGFSVHCSDRTKELTGKSRGGGVCFFINNSWCDEKICILLNPSAPLIWNFICFCVDHSGYRGNLQQ